MMILLVLLFLPLIVFWGVWLLFALVAALPGGGKVKGLEAREFLTIDVLIPAHDEEVLLPRLLKSLERQHDRQLIGRVVVVADHCSDGTAVRAREMGAEVLERSSGARGKPAALRDGLLFLKGLSGAPAGEGAVLILDADCTLSEEGIGAMARALSRGAKVVQAAYVLESVNESQKLASPATLAFALKNVVRPKGMARLHVPTQLFGTGMCFRREVLEGGVVRFEDHLTEDLKMSHDLLLAGIGPVFVEGAVVTSPLPAERKGMTTQKLRWEAGQIQAWRSVPGMMMRLARGMRGASLMALLDWSAPPVAMAIVYWALMTVVVGVCVGMRVASAWAFLLPVVSMGVLIAYVGVGALQVMGSGGTARLGLAAPRFFVWKMSLYGRMLMGRGARNWERTERGSESGATVEARS